MLAVSFSGGSVCSQNKSLKLSTNLGFKCSQFEKGPKVFSNSDCLYDIFWETPKACPYFVRTPYVNATDIMNVIFRKSRFEILMFTIS